MADGKIVIDTQIDTSGAEKGTKKLGGKLGSIAKGGFKAFTGAVTVAGTALTGLGSYALKVGSDFKAGMSKVQAISGATGNEMTDLTEKAIEMGSKTKFSATQSAEAMQYMAMAGWKTGDMLGGIEGIMNLAAASGEDLALTSDIVTDALTAFGMEAGESAKFADILAAASSNSNTNVAMLGESFKNVAPLAGSLGYSAKDTSIALGLMANAGIKASQSGTTLKTALVNMAKPTDAMKAIMDKYGLSLTNTDGSMKSLQQVMDMLRSKMGGLDKATQSAAAAQLFGKESLAGMLAVINASPGDYEKLTKAIYDSEGAAKKMADTMNDNLKGQIELLKSALDTLGIRLYTSVNNPMKDIVKTANEMVTQLTQAFQSGGISGLVSALGGVISQIVTGMAAQLPQIINLSVQVIQSFVLGIQSNLPQITNSSAMIIQSLVDGFINIMPQLIILGFNIVTAICNGISQNIPIVVAQISNMNGQMLFNINASVIKFVDAGANMILNLADGFSRSLPTLLPLVLELIVSIVNKIIENLPMLIDAGLKVIMALAQGLADNLPMLIETVPKMINDFVSAINSKIPAILATGVKIILALIEGLIKSIPTIVKNIPQIILAIVNAFMLFNWFKVGSGLIKTIGSGLSAMKGNIGSIAKSIASWVQKTIVNIFKGGLRWGKSLITSIGSGLKSMIGFLGSVARSVATGAINAIKSVFSGAVNIGKNLVQGLWNGIGSAKDWILSKIKGFTGSILTSIKDFFGIHSPSRVMRDLIGKNIVKGLEIGIQKRSKYAIQQVEDLSNRLLEKMKEATAKERAEIDKNNKEIGRIERRANEDIESIKRRAYLDKRKLTIDENNRIIRIEEDSAKKINNLKDKNRKIELDAIKKHNKEVKEEAEKYIEEKKKFEGLSLVDEIKFWDELMLSSEKGSETYDLALEKHFDRVKDLREKMTSVNQNYVDKINKIDKELVDKTKELNKKYEDELNNRIGALTNFSKIFDEFKENDVDGFDLITNLRGQVTALEDYTGVIDSLGGRIKNRELLDELRGLGVGSLGELKALNNLSDSQLQQYVILYEKKFALARKQATKELEPLREDVNSKIDKLNEESSNKISQLKNSWQSEIKNLVKTTDKQVDNMYFVGVDAVKQLDNGIKDMQPTLLNTAKNLIDNVKEVFSSKLGLDITFSQIAENLNKMNTVVGFETSQMANKMTAGINKTNNIIATLDTGDSDINADINVPVYLDGKKIAQATAPYSDVIGAKRLRLSNRGLVL